MKKLLSSLALVGALTTGVLAQDIWPLDISMFDWIARPTEVVGLRVGVPYGFNSAVTGFDVGLVGQSQHAWAFQVNAFYSCVNDTMGGLQVASVNYAGHLTGIQVSLWNTAQTMNGLQVGVINLADQVEGFQIGLINRTELMHGYQIGLVNVIRESPVPFAPVVNFMF